MEHKRKIYLGGRYKKNCNKRQHDTGKSFVVNFNCFWSSKRKINGSSVMKSNLIITKQVRGEEDSLFLSVFPCRCTGPPRFLPDAPVTRHTQSTGGRPCLLIVLRSSWEPRRLHLLCIYSRCLA